jgi:hypothetical protein
MQRGSEDSRTLPFRLALSHREKVRALTAHCDRDLADGTIDQARCDALRGFYTGQAALAEAAVARLRDKQRKAVADLERQLMELQMDQARLARSVAEKKRTPEQANEANRELMHRAQAINGEIAERRGLIDATATEDLGGFIDLPLDRYTRQSGPPTPPLPTADRILAFTIPFVACASVFLPWLAIGERAATLLHIGDLLASPEAGQAAPGVLFRFLWVLLVFLPLAALPIAASRNRHGAGWGLLALGIALMAGAAAPALGVARHAPELKTLDQLIGALRAGTAGYGGTGVVLIILGARRLISPDASLRTRLRGALILATAIAVMFIVGRLVLSLVPSGASAEFKVRLTDPDRGVVLVTGHNNGQRPLTVRVPWPEQGPTDAERRDAAHSYGIQVYVREQGRDTFQLLPFTVDAWRSRGAKIWENETVTAGAGMSRQLEMDARVLKKNARDAEAFRIDVTRADGTVVATFDAPFPENFASPAPARPQRPPTVTPTVPEIQPPPVPEPAETEPETVGPPKPSVAKPVTTVQYSGKMGEKVAVKVRYPSGQPAKKGLLVLGDEVTGGWTLEAITRDPDAITLKQSAGGRTLTIPLGEEKPLPLRGNAE